MAEVVRISARNKSGPSIRALRQEYGLSLVQLAQALNTHPSQVETWEANPGIGPTESRARSAIENFLDHTNERIDSNLIFGVYPLRLARELLEKGAKDIAADYGYTEQTWQKFELNTRLLKRKILHDLEQKIRDHFIEVCEASDD